MTRKLLSFLFAVCLLLSLAGCGGEKTQNTESSPVPTSAPAAPSATAAPTQAPTADAVPETASAPISFAQSFVLFQTVFNAVTEEIQQRVSTHNGVLEGKYPDSYYMNSSYLMLSYLPVWPAYPTLGSFLADDSQEKALEQIRQQFPDAQLSAQGPGAYEAVYTYVDKTSGEEVRRSGRCVWECDGGTGAFRVRAWVDDAMVEFTEFIPQGNGRYILYTATDKLLVTCPEGRVDALCFAHRICEPALGDFPGDMRLCSLAEQDFYPAGTADESWILSDDNAQYTLNLEAGDMTLTGKVSQDLLNDTGEKIGLFWQPIDSILLLK